MRTGLTDQIDDTPRAYLESVSRCGCVCAMPQPHRGDRVPILSRPPRPVGDAVRTAAHERGMSVSDYVASVLADVHGMPELAPAAHPGSGQGELPLVAKKGGARLARTA